MRWFDVAVIADHVASSKPIRSLLVAFGCVIIALLLYKITADKWEKIQQLSRIADDKIGSKIDPGAAAVEQVDAPADTRIDQVVQTWSKLPENVRDQIVSLVAAAAPPSKLDAPKPEAPSTNVATPDVPE